MATYSQGIAIEGAASIGGTPATGEYCIVTYLLTSFTSTSGSSPSASIVMYIGAGQTIPSTFSVPTDSGTATYTFSRGVEFVNQG